jgi:hypothetical protein
MTVCGVFACHVLSFHHHATWVNWFIGECG